jgi:hypothetical protein
MHDIGSLTSTWSLFGVAPLWRRSRRQGQEAIPRGVSCPPEAKRGGSVGSLLSFVRRVPFGGWWSRSGWRPLSLSPAASCVVVVMSRTRPARIGPAGRMGVGSQVSRHWNQTRLNATRRTSGSGLPTEASLLSLGFSGIGLTNTGPTRPPHRPNQPDSPVATGTASDRERRRDPSHLPQPTLINGRSNRSNQEASRGTPTSGYATFAVALPPQGRPPIPAYRC